MNITSKDIAATIRIEIPGLKTVSEANAHEHWRKRQVRAKLQRGMALVVLMQSNEIGREVANGRCQSAGVKLTRIGPRKLDDDNLQGALKHVRDGVADYFGRDDGSDFYRWEYAQEKGEYGVRIEITPKSMEAQ